MKRKLLAIVLAVAMVVTMLPLSVAATQPTTHRVTDDSQLAQALAIAQSGDTIELAAGTYTTPISFNREISLTIVGANADNDPNGNEWDSANETIITGGIILGSDNEHIYNSTITIKGITFQERTLIVNEYKENVIQNNKFQNITKSSGDNTSNADAIRIVDPKGGSVTITNNRIEGAADAGIDIRNAKNVAISSNYITTTTTNAIQLQGSTNGDVTITENALIDWGQSAEGRALRISYDSGATGLSTNIAENKMVLDNPVSSEEFVKATNLGSNTISLENNYWNGENPKTNTGIVSILSDGSNPVSDFTIDNYYETPDMGDEPEDITPLNFFAFLLMKRFMTEYAITVETEGDGVVVSDDEDNLVRFSKNITFTAVAGEGSELTSILLDGEEVELPAENEYTIEKVKKAHTITFIFSEVEQELAE